MKTAGILVLNPQQILCDFYIFKMTIKKLKRFIYVCVEDCGARSVYMGPQPPFNSSVDSEAENTDDGEGTAMEKTRKPHKLPLDMMDPQQTYRTLTAILDCVQSLDRVHSAYNEAKKRHSAIEGSK